MSGFLLPELSAGCRKTAAFLLALAFVFGLILGSIVSFGASVSFIPAMRAASFGRVSIFGLLSATALPFLFSAFAVYTKMTCLLPVIAFCKAFLFSFLAVGIMQAFGSAGWLIKFLLMFADTLSTPMLYWYWLDSLSGCSGFSKSRVLMPFSCCLIIGIVDYCFVSPLIAEII